MKGAQAIIVDLSSLARVVRRETDLFISPEIYETWLAQCYAKAHAIPCVSANIVTHSDREGFFARRDELVRIASKHRFDPIEMLPAVPWSKEPNASVWMYFRNDQLLMGTSRAIKTCWGDLYHRFS